MVDHRFVWHLLYQISKAIKLVAQTPWDFLSWPNENKSYPSLTKKIKNQKHQCLVFIMYVIPVKFQILPLLLFFHFHVVTIRSTVVPNTRCPTNPDLETWTLAQFLYNPLNCSLHPKMTYCTTQMGIPFECATYGYWKMVKYINVTPRTISSFSQMKSSLKKLMTKRVKFEVN